MKKSFIKNLSKAMLLAVMAAPVCFTSCYDDSDLVSEIDRLDKELESVKKDIEKLKSELDDQVVALTKMVQNVATVSSFTYDDQTKEYVITLSSGETFKVKTPSTPVDDLPVLVTMVQDENGNYYWAIKGEDGKIVPVTGNDGKNLPVVSAVPQFQIDPDYKTISISFDGGQTWMETGITAGNNVFQNCYVENGKAVFVLADGSKFAVNFAGASASFNLASSKLFFQAGETKSVKVLASNIKGYTVTEKPEGWIVTSSAKELTVTAPESESANGVIKVLAVDNNGASYIASLAVEIGEPIVNMEYDVNTLNYKISLSESFADEFTMATYYITPASEFNYESIVAKIQNSEYPSTCTIYDAGEYEGNLNNLMLDMATYDTIPLKEGETYILWALPYVMAMNWDTYQQEFVADESDLVAECFTVPGASLEITELTAVAANVRAKVAGYEKYYFTVVEFEQEAFDMGYDLLINDIQGALSWGYGQGKFFTSDYEGSINNYLGYEMFDIVAGRTYEIAVVPVSADLNPDSITRETIQYEKITIPAYGLNGRASVEISDADIADKKASFKLTPVNAKQVFYCNYDKNSYPQENEVETIIKDCCTSFDLLKEPEQLEFKRLTGDTEYILAAIAVDQYGRRSDVIKYEYKTEASYHFVDGKTIGTEVLSASCDEVVIKLTQPEGADNLTSYRYIYGLMSEIHFSPLRAQNEDEIPAKAENLLANNELYTIQKGTFASLTDGKITIPSSKLKAGQDYWFAAIATSDDGTYITHVSVQKFYTKWDFEYFKADSQEWKDAVQPKIVINKESYSYREDDPYEMDGQTIINRYYRITYGVELDATVDSAWVLYDYNASFDAKYPEGRDKIIQLVKGGMSYCNEFPKKSSASFTANDVNVPFWITWKDKNGKYYEPVKVMLSAFVNVDGTLVE